VNLRHASKGPLIVFKNPLPFIPEAREEE